MVKNIVKFSTSNGGRFLYSSFIKMIFFIIFCLLSNNVLSAYSTEAYSFENDIQSQHRDSLEGNGFAIINLSVANMRSKPSHPEELSTQALLGTVVNVLEAQDGWYKIQTPEEYVGWIDEEGLVRVTHDEILSWIESEKVIYLMEYGFCYSKPDNNSQRVSDLVLGDILQYLEEDGNYVKVKFPDDRTAYIEKEYAMNFKEWTEITNLSSEKIIETAKKFMGVPYLWGGTSAKGMDCSGFTKTTYFMNGVILPRNASQQVNTGELIDTKDGFENLKPGDLLFFGFKATEEKKERITHVAIYLGSMDFIHASGRVRINSFDKSKDNFSQFRYDHFIRAKRILNSIDKNGITTVKSNKFYTGEGL